MQLLTVLLVVLWSTARHEAAHAVAVVLRGGTIHEMRLLPGLHPDQGFYFGYVAHSGASGWVIDAAPFLLDVALLVATALWISRIGPRRRTLLLFGVVSPLADLAYGYLGGLWRPGTDVHDLFAALPDLPVHLYFWVAILAAALLLRRSRTDSTADPLGRTEPRPVE